MNKKCAAFVFVGTITCICLNFGQFSPLKTHRINLYTVNAVKVLTLLNDIMVAAKMLTSRVWYQSVTEWVKMAIMCNLLVNWDKLLKTTNPYIITWKSSPICILCNHLVIESGPRGWGCCPVVTAVSKCKKGQCNFSVLPGVCYFNSVWLKCDSSSLELSSQQWLSGSDKTTAQTTVLVTWSLSL